MSGIFICHKKLEPGRGKKKGRTLYFLWEYFKLQYQADTAFTDSQTQGRYWVSESETVISVF